MNGFRAMADVFLKIGRSESLSSEGVVTAGSGTKYNLTEQVRPTVL